MCGTQAIPWEPIVIFLSQMWKPSISAETPLWQENNFQDPRPLRNGDLSYITREATETSMNDRLREKEILERLVKGWVWLRSTSDSPGFPAVMSVTEFIPLPILLNFPSENWSSCCQNRLQGKDFAEHGGVLAQISAVAGQISRSLSLLDILVWTFCLMQDSSNGQSLLWSSHQVAENLSCLHRDLCLHRHFTLLTPSQCLFPRGPSECNCCVNDSLNRL